MNCELNLFYKTLHKFISWKDLLSRLSNKYYYLLMLIFQSLLNGFAWYHPNDSHQ